MKLLRKAPPAPLGWGSAAPHPSVLLYPLAVRVARTMYPASTRLLLRLAARPRLAGRAPQVLTEVTCPLRCA